MNEIIILQNPIIAYFVFCALIIIPLFKIFQRTGLSPLMILTLFLPFAGFPIITFILAYNLWPVRNPLKLKKRTKEEKL